MGGLSMAEAVQAAEGVETARASLRHLRVSPQKARLVIDLVRGKGVEEALSILKFSHKAVAKDVYKLLWSAIHNAKEKESLGDESELYIQEAYVDGGPTMKRGRPASMGRVYRILHRTSHITLVLALVAAKPH